MKRGKGIYNLLLKSYNINDIIFHNSKRD